MTNKPMLSVERNPLGISSEAYSVMLGMVEHCLNIRACMGMDEGFKDFDIEEEHDFVKELRALLDKASCIKCNDTGEADSGGVQPWGEGINIPCDCAPAAQHQGEPVAYTTVGMLEIAKRLPLTGRISAKSTKDERWNIPLFLGPTEQPAPLKIGSGVTVENIGFGSEQERKPYLVFASNGCLTEVNLIDVSLVSKRKAYTISDLEAIGVRVEQAAPAELTLDTSAYRVKED